MAVVTTGAGVWMVKLGVLDSMENLSLEFYAIHMQCILTER